MKENQNTALRPALAALGLLALASTAVAQTFTYAGGDLCLTFRDASSDTYEVVADVGPASTYLSLAPGSTNPITAYNASSQLAQSFTDFDNLNWAVVGGFQAGSGYSGYPAYTLWLTVPRDPNNPGVQSAAALRHYSSEQVGPYIEINSILNGAGFISSAIGSANQYNTATFVREDTSLYASHVESAFMKSQATSSLGTLDDTWTDNDLESQTALAAGGFFTGSGQVERADLYEIRPLDNGHGGTIVDPHTGTTGQAYYVGYFQLASDGSMSFVRSSAVRTPPPPAQLSLHRTNNVNTISFVSSNTAVYTLCFTNAAGLSAPVSTWPTGVGLTGNGALQSLQDTTTDAARFYRVKGQ